MISEEFEMKYVGMASISSAARAWQSVWWISVAHYRLRVELPACDLLQSITVQFKYISHFLPAITGLHFSLNLIFGPFPLLLIFSGQRWDFRWKGNITQTWDIVSRYSTFKHPFLQVKLCSHNSMVHIPKKKETRGEELVEQLIQIIKIIGNRSVTWLCTNSVFYNVANQLISVWSSSV